MNNVLKSTILFCAISTLIYSCSSEKKHEEQKEVEEQQPLELAKVELLQPENSLTFPGELESFYATDIFPKINSYIKAIYVDIGDKVKEGQILVQLEAPEVESQLSEAYSKMKSAEATFGATQANYKRLLQTNKTVGAVSVNDIEYAKAHTVSDSLQVVAATVHYNSEQQINTYLKITAPFDGIITDRQLAPGGFVGPGERSVVPILKIKNESKLRLHIAIPERYIAEIEEGKNINFTVKSFPNNTFKGEISRLSKNVDTKTRSEIIEILIDNTDSRLMPGMYATVLLPSKRNEKSLFVPETAIVTNMEKCFVIKVDSNKKAHWVSVQKGDKSKDKTEVYGDLKEGDTIIKQGSDEIKDGSIIDFFLTK
ncbi:MAG TPA: efflux RND transporter periplasmic adaptor subunit [Bacteroidia bacterium]|jgi:membrane fusion protein (multidrug efflux system)|nr:efflux RND transporter periplasmic adaptor subunit [Bacteroidia bacterium]